MSIAETEAEAKANFAAALPPPTRSAPAAAPSGGADAGPSRGATAAQRTLVGTPDQIRAILKEYVPVGLTEMCVIFYSPSTESAERQTRLFADEVMAKF